MPIIIISGYPSSGKTYRTNQLKEYFEGRDKKVIIVSENKTIPKSGFTKNEFYAESKNEKQVRAELMSDSFRYIDRNNVIILDAGNYIKGYRYQLYCDTKSICSNQCTLFCAIQKDKAWEFNCKRTRIEENPNDLGDDNSDVPYSKEIFDALCMRYEEPHGNHRWDSPLFVTFPEDELDFNGIYAALFESKPLPANRSTEATPSSTDFIYELDKITQQVVGDVLAARKIGIMGPVPTEKANTKVNIPDHIGAAQLNRMRRQFLTYSKMHVASTTIENAPQLFVQYLNSSFNK